MEITKSRYLVTAGAMPVQMRYKPRMERAHRDHWHRPDRLKTCAMCGEEKALGEFYAYGYTTRQGKLGTRYESRCRPCAQARRRAAVAADPDRSVAENKAWRARNPSAAAASAKAYRASPEGRVIKAKLQRLRKARLRSGEGDNEAIRAIYAEAVRIEALVAVCPVFDLPELGHKMHVDHVMPLSKGGRHHEDNLQILPIGINMRKGARCPR